jgi:hypothetical protein
MKSKPQQPTSELQPVDVRYEHSLGLPALLEHLKLSLLLSTYQADRVMSVGSSHRSEQRRGFTRFDQAMGLTSTASSITVGSRDVCWSFLASREIAPRIKPEGKNDIAFLARSCQYSGPLMGHDLAWGSNRLWLVNTMFNGLVTIEGNWSFVPQWQPPFISGWVIARIADETNHASSTRTQQSIGTCRIRMSSEEVVLKGGSRNLLFNLALEFSRAGFMGGLFRLRIAIEKALTWLPPPAATG